MVVGNVIGTGIFSQPVKAATASGNVEIIACAWIIGAISCVLGGLCFAELALMFPQAGGLYVYLKEAYGKRIAFLFGWSEFVFGRPASIAVYAILLISQIESILQTSFSLFQSVALSAIPILLLAGLNVRGVIWGGRMQGLTTLVKCLFLVLLGALPFALMSQGHTGIEAANYRSTMSAEFTSPTAQFAAALLAVLWAYNGWHAICPIAEEVRNPNRTIRFALFVGLGIILALYGFVNVAYHGSMTMEEIGAAGFVLPQKMAEKLLLPVSSQLAGMASLVISLSISISMLGGININLMNGPRVAFAVGREEAGVRFLSWIHPRFHTPTISILFQAGMAICGMLAVAVALSVAGKGDARYLFFVLTDYVVFSASIFYLLTVAAVIVLRHRLPDATRTFRTPWSPWLPLAYLLFNVWFLWEVFLGDRFQAGVSIGLSLLGLPLLAAIRWRDARRVRSV